MRIGTIDIDRPLLLAPMEDVTDVSFRLVCKRLGADIMYTEFVNAEGLARKSKQAHRKMEFLEEERPFGIQIYGSQNASMETAAKMAEALGPDIIDINCGCWVKNVAGHGAGAGLLRDPDKMRGIVTSVVNAVKTPVTVKTRLGWDNATIRIAEVARMIEDTGAAALTIHCRTRDQGHSGDPDYRWIPIVKEAIRIPVIVNGGIDSAQKAQHVFASTGCDGVMVARAAIAHPWIFHETKHYFETGEFLPEPTFAERVALLLSHLALSVEHKGEQRGVTEFRKHYAGYLRGVPGVARLRMELMAFVTLRDVEDHLNRFLEHGTSETAALEPHPAGITS